MVCVFLDDLLMLLSPTEVDDEEEEEKLALLRAIRIYWVLFQVDRLTRININTHDNCVSHWYVECSLNFIWSGFPLHTTRTEQNNSTHNESNSLAFLVLVLVAALSRYTFQLNFIQSHYGLRAYCIAICSMESNEYYVCDISIDL